MLIKKHPVDGLSDVGCVSHKKNEWTASAFEDGKVELRESWGETHRVRGERFLWDADVGEERVLQEASR